MAYAGYLVKVGDYTVPFKFIRPKSFKAVWSTNDLESYRDADGELHRQALSRKTLKVEWNIPAMSSDEVEEFLAGIQDEYTNDDEKCALVTAWMPEIGAYVTDKCYLASSITFTIASANETSLEYEETRVAFIGYSTSTAE